MARGIAVLRAAIENGQRVRVDGDSAWAIWDPGARCLTTIPDGGRSRYGLESDPVWEEDWEIEPITSLTFAAAYAAMQRGMTIADNNGTCYRLQRMPCAQCDWRRETKLERYSAHGPERGWQPTTFSPHEIEYTNWHIVRDDPAAEPDDRPTLEDAAAYVRRAYGPNAWIDPVEVLNVVGKQWPAVFRKIKT